MTNSLKSQLELTADASGVEAGVNKAKKSLASLGVTAAAEGQKAAAGIDKIGAGGENASKKVDKTTRSLIQSIERTTATLEAGGRANTKYFETLATQRGVDPAALRPYLDQLDAVVKKNGEAEQALLGGGKQLNAYGISAKQTAAAMRQVPAQLTDIFVGLQGGQAPLTVLLQQGGQLKDVFGGVVPAAKALGSAVVGLINPLTLTAGAVVALGVAYNQGSKEAQEYSKALILTGNATGQTSDGLASMAARIDGVVGTQYQAAAALAEFAANGNIAGASLEKFATVAIRMERITGQAVKDTVKQFADLGKSPVEASLKLNESTNFLTESVYKQIRALESQGKTTEAAAVAQKAYADAMTTRLGEIESKLGLVEKAWGGIKKAAAESWDAMLDIGRAKTLTQQIEDAEKLLAARQAAGAGGKTSGGNAQFETNEDIKARLETLKETQRLISSVADRQRAATEQVKARAEFDKESDKYIDKRVQMEREIARVTELGAKAGASRVEQERLIAAIREKYKEPDKTGQSQDQIIAAKIAPDVEIAQAMVDADFKTAQDLAEAQIKALETARETERKQVFEMIDKEQEDAIAKGAELLKGIAEESKRANEFVKSLGMTFSSVFEDAIVKGKSYSDVLAGIGEDLARLAVRKAITEPAVNAIGSINWAQLFSSFDGGGYTGSSSRSGGLDGKGGFMAMLHPQETVVDHTRGQMASSALSGSPIVYSPVFNIDSRTDRQEILQLTQRMVQQGHAGLVDKLTRQERL